jgi:spermidine synthase
MLYIEDISYKVPEFLKKHNFIVPKICLYEDENLEITLEKFKNPPHFFLYLNTEKYKKDWVMYYSIDHTMGYYYFPEYDMSYGHVLITGLGMNMLPNWIATKPEVTKITVIENNKYLIDYVKEYGYIDSKIDIIHADANSFIGEYDVFFCDHNYGKTYSFNEKSIDYLNKLLENIKCNIIWNQRIPKISNYNYDTYQNLRKLVSKLPDINKKKFELYKRLYHGNY